MILLMCSLNFEPFMSAKDEWDRRISMVILPYEIFIVGKLCYVLVTERWVGMEEILAHGNACLIIVFDTGLYLLLQSLKLKDGWERRKPLLMVIRASCALNRFNGGVAVTKWRGPSDRSPYENFWIFAAAYIMCFHLKCGRDKPFTSCP